MNIDRFIDKLTNDMSLIDTLPDDLLELLIKYLEYEIKRKQALLGIEEQ